MTDTLRDGAAKAEKDSRFSKAQSGIFHEQNWFKMLTPTAYRGQQLALPEALQHIESIAWVDGSAGWLVATASMAGWLANYMDIEIAKDIFSDERAMLASCTSINGRAERTSKGYLVSGKWPNISASADTTVFIANCIVTKNGVPIKDSENKNEVLSFVFFKPEFTVVSNWSPMGLAAAGLATCEVKDIAVSANRAFAARPRTAKADAPLYRFPYQQLCEATLALCVSGMALHFIDNSTGYLEDIINEDGVSLANDENVQDSVKKSAQKLYDARVKLYYAIELSWQACGHNQHIKPAVLYKVSSGAYDLARRARECVDTIYPYCGMHAVDKYSDINRVFRDLHTACQHKLLVHGGSIE